MSINYKKIKTALLTTPYGSSKRQYPMWRWMLIVFVVTLPLLILIYILFRDLFFVTAPGVIKFDTVTVRSPTDGYVNKLHVHTGDKVKKGQLLINFESPEIIIQLKNLEKEKKYLEALIADKKNNVIPMLEKLIQADQQNIEESKKVYDQFINFRKIGTSNEVLVENTRINYVNAHRDYILDQQALSQQKYDFQMNLEKNYIFRLHEMQNEINRLTVINQHLDLTAPITGTIIIINTYNGEYISKGLELLSLVGEENLRIFAYIKPKYSREVYKDKQVTIVLPNNKQIPGKIVNIPTFAETLPSAQANPLAAKENQLIIVVKPTQTIPKEFQIYHLPVKIDFF